MTAAGPTVLRRYVALELRRLRQAAGYEREEVARRIGAVRSHISHLEVARNLPKIPELELLLNFYGAADRTDAFRELVEAARRGKDWWEAFAGATPEWFDLYLGLESAAAQIEGYDSLIVPGLFHTPRYAAAVIRSGRPELSDAEVEARVQLRMARQDVLTRQPTPPTIWTVLDESVLYRSVADGSVLAEQLQHLAKLAELQTVNLRILPLSAGFIATGTFALLTFPPEFQGDPGVVYTEDDIRGTYYESADEVQRYRDVFRRVLLATLSPDDTRALIARRIKELSS
ncbi:MAG: helix-turn-helix domain-containing protein [Pseudonocardiales bacterium]|nr:helix-turn-helix domain-containing protein [Pseudonocardiales bacterium]